MMPSVNMVFSRFFAIFLLIVSSHGVVSMTDKATGISFPPEQNGLELLGVGVRKKGPIKIYSVAMYCRSAVKQKLAEVSKSEGKTPFGILRSGAKENSTTFLLNMNFKVGRPDTHTRRRSILSSFLTHHFSGGG
jgi:hypothetical protein